MTHRLMHKTIVTNIVQLVTKATDVTQCHCQGGLV